MSPFDRRREAIREAREDLARASYRQRLEALKRGDFDDEEEALEGIERGPFEVSDDDVLQSFAQDLDTVSAMRSTIQKHGAKWSESVRQRWRYKADLLERNARSGLGLGEAA